MRATRHDAKLVGVTRGGHGARFEQRARLGVRDLAGLAVNARRRQAVEQLTRRRPLDEEFAHEGHVDQRDALTAGGVLGGPVVKPVVPPPRKLANGRLLTGRRVPIRRLEPRDIAEARPALGEARVQRRVADGASTVGFAVRVVALVDLSERLDDARAAIRRSRLVGVEARRVDAGDVDIGSAVDDPVRHSATNAGTRQDSYRVEPGGDEVAAELRRLRNRSIGRAA